MGENAAKFPTKRQWVNGYVCVWNVSAKWGQQIKTAESQAKLFPCQWAFNLISYLLLLQGNKGKT